MTPQLNKVHTHTHTHTERMSLLCLSCRHILTSWFRQTETNPLGHRNTSLSLPPSFHESFPFSWSAAPSRGDEGRQGWRLERWMWVIHRYTVSLLREWCDREEERGTRASRGEKSRKLISHGLRRQRGNRNTGKWYLVLVSCVICTVFQIYIKYIYRYRYTA